MSLAVNRLLPLALFPLLVACGASRAQVSGYELQTLAGTWQADSGATMTLEKAGKSIVVTSYIDSDGEVFEVQKHGIEDGAFGWTYLVPSTGYVVSERVSMVAGNDMDTVWSNSAGDSGPDHYTRQ